MKALPLFVVSLAALAGCSSAAETPGGAGGSGAGSGADVGSGGAGSAPSSGTGGASGAGGAAAAAGGTGGGAATSACDAAGVLFCEDFEGHAVGALPGAPWVSTIVGDGGSIVVDAETPAHGGVQSLEVTSGGNYQTFLTLTGAPVFPAPAGPLYVRVYLRLSEAMSAGHNTYFKAGASGASSSEHETRVGVMVEMLMINQPAGDRGFLSNQNYWTDQLPGAVALPESWTCIEGAFDPANSTISVALGGADIPDLHVTDWQQDPIGALHFGFEQYAGPGTTLWYDDIVVSTEPIGCAE